MSQRCPNEIGAPGGRGLGVWLWDNWPGREGRRDAGINLSETQFAFSGRGSTRESNEELR